MQKHMYVHMYIHTYLVHMYIHTCLYTCTYIHACTHADGGGCVGCEKKVLCVEVHGFVCVFSHPAHLIAQGDRELVLRAFAFSHNW